jgi:hypothetical protein
MLSKSPRSSALYDTRLECCSTALDMFVHFDLQQLVRLLVVSFYKEQSISTLALLALTQTTTIRPIPELLLIRHLDLVQPVFPLREGVALLFFEPNFDRVSRHTKCPCQSSHATALLIGSYNLFTTLFRITIWCRIFTALSLTCFTTISLFSIWCIAITHQLFTSAVLTANCDCYHKGSSFLGAMMAGGLLLEC